MLKATYQITISSDISPTIDDQSAIQMVPFDPSEWVESNSNKTLTSLNNGGTYLGTPFFRNPGYISKVDDVDCNENLDNITQTAKFKIHKRFIQELGGHLFFFYGEDVPYFSIGIEKTLIFGLKSRVEISLGYGSFDSFANLVNNNDNGYKEWMQTHGNCLQRIFNGFITSITQDEHYYIFTCEDNMATLKVLKRDEFTLSGTSSMEQVINYINKKWNINIKYAKKNLSSSLKSITIKNLQYYNMNPAEILSQLKKDLGLTIFFRRNYLFIGGKFYQSSYNKGGWSSFSRIQKFTYPWFPPQDYIGVPATNNGTNPVISMNLNYTQKSIDDNYIPSINTKSVSLNGKEYRNVSINAKYNGINYDIKLKGIKKKNNVYVHTELSNYLLSNGYIDLGTEFSLNAHKFDISDNFTKKEIFNLAIANIDNNFEEIKNLLFQSYNDKKINGVSGKFTTFGTPNMMVGDFILGNFVDADQYPQQVSKESISLDITYDKNRYKGYIRRFEYGQKDNTADSAPDEILGIQQVNFFLYFVNSVSTRYSKEVGLRQEIEIIPIQNTIDKDILENTVQLYELYKTRDSDII